MEKVLTADKLCFQNEKEKNFLTINPEKGTFYSYQDDTTGLVLGYWSKKNQSNISDNYYTFSHSIPSVPAYITNSRKRLCFTIPTPLIVGTPILKELQICVRLAEGGYLYTWNAARTNYSACNTYATENGEMGLIVYKNGQIANNVSGLTDLRYNYLPNIGIAVTLDFAEAFTKSATSTNYVINNSPCNLSVRLSFDVEE